ncbi:MAG: hypothetical protein HY711_07240 [Candidatus Melainabacteria bacterium]|nr:hypothetical protein [Candidatus Melainabacteria bacterium]
MFQRNSKVMAVSDRDVITKLIDAHVFDTLRLTSLTLEGQTIKCATQAGLTLEIPGIVSFQRGILRKEFVFPAGRLTIERDGLELLVEVFYRQEKDGGIVVERKVLRCALRDRQLDGTKETSPLSAFPNTHEATNQLPHPDFKAAELSIYCYDPDRYLPAGEMLDFIMNVDDFTYKHFEPVRFFQLWTRAFEASNMAPWQPAPPLKGVAQHFVEAAGPVLAEQGYHRMDAVAGWFNAALFFIERMKFAFTYGEHQAAFNELQRALRQMESRIGRRLNQREQAWVVALQNIPAKFIPDELNLGCRWINTPTYTDYVCRLHKDLTPFPPDPRLSVLVLPKVFAKPTNAQADNPAPEDNLPVPPPPSTAATSPAQSPPAT